MIHIRELLRQVKEKDNEMAEVDVVGRDQVEHAFLEKQRAARIAEREIEGREREGEGIELILILLCLRRNAGKDRGASG